MRVLRVLLLLVLVLVGLFYAGGGWYFSSRIGTDVLQVSPYPDREPLRLTPVGAHQVRLAALDLQPEERAELAQLRNGGLFGLVYPGGYAQVTGPLSGPSRDVARLHVLAGSPPRSGARGHLALDAWPPDRPDLAWPGARVRTLTFPSALGPLPAYAATLGGPPGTTHPTWAVLVHGKGGDRAEMYRMGAAMLAAGASVLDIGYRNDPGLPRDPSGHYRYGATEWHDLDAAVRYAATHGARRIVLGGDSMGGAVVASYLRHAGPVPSGAQVVGAVLDAPMLDLAATIRNGAQMIRLPVIGPVPDSLTAVAEWIATRRFGLDLPSADYLGAARWARVPILLFHGTADTTVPISTSRRLAEEVPGVRLVVVPGAEHVRSWNSDPTAYRRRVVAFVHQLAG